jgi:hypothetical protein
MSIYETLDVLHVALPGLAPPWRLSCPSGAAAIWSSWAAISPRKTGNPKSASWERISRPSKAKTPLAVAIDLMGTLHAAVGDLNRVTGIVKLMVLVNGTPAFTEQHLVANGASELFEEVLGDRGKHVRSSFGIAQVGDLR